MTRRSKWIWIGILVFLFVVLPIFYRAYLAYHGCYLPDGSVRYTGYCDFEQLNP